MSRALSSPSITRTRLRTTEVVLLRHTDGARLANQLWNVAAVFAYCVERRFDFRDVSNSDYRSGFPETRNPVAWGDARRSSPLPQIRRLGEKKKARRLLAAISGRLPPVLIQTVKHQVAPVIRAPDTVFYLPPSPVPREDARLALSSAEKVNGGRIYFSGWPFKNPVGLRVHRRAILDFLRPTEYVAVRVAELFAGLRGRYQSIVGVHLRQGDYRSWLGGKLAVTPEEAADILREYIEWRQLRAREVLFVVCSDEPVPLHVFEGLEVMQGPGGIEDDMFALAACDAIIGSNSTYGGFASYIGDVPLILLRRGGMNWDRYADRTGYEEDPDFVMNLLRGVDEGFTSDGSFFTSSPNAH